MGGIESIIYAFTKKLNENHIKCDVLCSNSTYQYQEDLEIESNTQYKIMRTKSFGKLFATSITPEMIFKLCSISSEYDIIHIHQPDPIANLALFFAKPQCKVILHWHSDIIRQKFLLFFYLPLQKWLLNRADLILATNPKYIEESPILKSYQCKTVSIPGISLDCELDKKIVSDLISKYIKKQHKIILGVGRLVEYKGFYYLIEAAKYLPNDCHIIIVGDGPLKKKLEKHIQNLQVSDKVFLVGKVSNEELHAYYQICDIFCLSSISRAEVYGVVQVEAMKYGKPIVSTSIPGSGVDWVNQNGITGYTVPIKDSKTLAKALNNLCNNEHIRKEFSSNAKKRYKELFQTNIVIQKLIQIYNNLLAQ